MACKVINVVKVIDVKDDSLVEFTFFEMVLNFEGLNPLGLQ